ncbi:MAG: hypothetical protein NVS3B10_24190 [Polyangiales bacterium]
MERGSQVRIRRALWIISVLSLGVVAGCGGARKPCSAPVRSLDVAPSPPTASSAEESNAPRCEQADPPR